MEYHVIKKSIQFLSTLWLSLSFLELCLEISGMEQFSFLLAWLWSSSMIILRMELWLDWLSIDIPWPSWDSLPYTAASSITITSQSTWTYLEVAIRLRITYFLISKIACILLDPIWAKASKSMNFINSLKMKIAVIIAIIHMFFGLILKGCNFWFKKQKVLIWL